MMMMEMMTMMTHHWVELAASMWQQQKSLLSGSLIHSMGHLALKSHRDGDDDDDEVDNDNNDDEDLAL